VLDVADPVVDELRLPLGGQRRRAHALLLGLPLGAVVGSLIAENFGLRATLVVSAFGVLVGPLPLLVSGIARVQVQPEHSA
jgi:uncharacterized membrane protein YoaK (UPF0700 family)